MIEETTICSVCGNSMLVRTAEKYRGKCVPCKQGFREGIEQGKRYYAEMRALEKHPSTLFWRSLCERVDDPSRGFDSLTDAEQLYFAVCLLEGEVYNGGFDQYFTNLSSNYFFYAIKGLEKVKDSVAMQIVHQAKNHLFGEQAVPEDRQLRWEIYESLRIDENEATQYQLTKLDTEFTTNYDLSLRYKLLEFAFANKFWGDDETAYQF